jgi:hypothetical protein
MPQPSSSPLLQGTADRGPPDKTHMREVSAAIKALATDKRIADIEAALLRLHKQIRVLRNERSSLLKSKRQTAKFTPEYLADFRARRKASVVGSVEWVRWCEKARKNKLRRDGLPPMTKEQRTVYKRFCYTYRWSREDSIKEALRPVEVRQSQNDRRRNHVRVEEGSQAVAAAKAAGGR